MNKNKLLIVSGVPGSGKTFVGKELAKRLGIFIDKDTISRFFTEKLLTVLGSDKDDRESATYLTNVRDLEYDTMLKHAVENLELGYTVVCSAPFIREIQDETWTSEVELAVELADATLVKIWVQVDAPTARERIIDRNASRDVWKLANWETYLAMTPHSPPATVPGLIVLDNSAAPERPIFEQIESLVATLETSNINAF